MSKLVSVRDACFSYVPERPIFHDVNLYLEEGKVFTILGPNGAGKSTLLNAMVGLLELNSGAIEVKGADVRSYSRKDLARIIGYIPQVISSVFQYSVLDYLVMGRAPYIATFARPTQAEYDMAYEKLQVMGVERLADRLFSELSGGERQQVAIARVLVQDPQLILFDEPTSALDFGNQMRVIKIVQQLVEAGYACVLTTHTPDHAVILGGTVGALDRHGVMTVGSVDKIINDGFLSDLYNADVHVEHLPSIGRKACFVH